eukprot:TRINITY_DN7902_c0_g1_i1.p1 TRINITY_DN7902_c0_g1~~TRINITY_DN7902_c0_g1_i1.p1  ORF type:complete len:334 (-),score=111.03 TRINITY_DN7902_c0_g1_i1:31-999(-)
MKQFKVQKVSKIFNKKFFSTTNKKLGDSIGFIGLGNMGFPMASNLVKAGYNVVGFDVNQGTVDRFVSVGGKSAKSPKEIAQQVDKIVTMLPSSPHVLSVYTGEEGILKNLKSPALLIDTSTIDPNVAREVSKYAQQQGSEMIDAPVSGGVGGATAGTLTFMIGGEQSTFEKAKLILEKMGKNIVYCGSTGNGQVVKICNNMMLAISMAGVSEAYNLGVKLGMDPKVMAGIFNTSSARCWSSDTYNPVPGVMQNVPSSRGYEGGFGVDLMAKDVGLAVNAANSVKAPIPLGSASLQIYNLLSQQGFGGKDFSVVYEFLNKNKK